MALDDPTRKMSKSEGRAGSSILLSDEPEVVTKTVRSAVTDSGREVRAAPDKPALTNLLTIFSLLEGSPIPELEERFATSGYGDFKAALAEAIVQEFAPVRTRYLELMSDPAEISRLLERGAERAAEVAETTMELVRERVGLLGRSGSGAPESRLAGRGRR